MHNPQKDVGTLNVKTWEEKSNALMSTVKAYSNKENSKHVCMFLNKTLKCSKWEHMF